MGQIQNAILNALGSVQQMTQLYKLTDAYVEGQNEKRVAAAKAASEEEAKQKYEAAETKRIRNRTAQQAEADILAIPFTEEEEKQFAERYKDLENATPQKRGKAKGDFTDQIALYTGEFTDPEYAKLIREREWLRQKYPTKAERDKKEKANKSPQEQADSNANIKAARARAKGGKK